MSRGHDGSASGPSSPQASESSHALVKQNGINSNGSCDDNNNNNNNCNANANCDNSINSIDSINNNFNQNKNNNSNTNANTMSNGIAKLLATDSLLKRIFEEVATTSSNARNDLRSMSLVNKQFHNIADKFLYRHVRFKNPLHHLTFGQSLQRRSRRGSIVEVASIDYPDSQLSHLNLNGHIENSHHAPQHCDSLSRTLTTMSYLRVLEISVPVALLHGIGAVFNGPFDLSYLKSCSLFYQCPDNGYWDLRENIHIFAHPTLETLYIRRAKLDYKGFDLPERPHDLALKKLTLIECDISEDALSDIAELPEALEEFVMTQSAEPTPELEESSDNMRYYIAALKSQCHSLVSITMELPTMRSYGSLRMREFEALQTLRVSWDWQLFGIKKKGKARLDSFGVPPNLKTLEFFNELGTDEEVKELLDYLIETSPVVANAIHTTLIPSVNAQLANGRRLLERNRQG